MEMALFTPGSSYDVSSSNGGGVGSSGERCTSQQQRRLSLVPGRMTSGHDSNSGKSGLSRPNPGRLTGLVTASGQLSPVPGVERRPSTGTPGLSPVTAAAAIAAAASWQPRPICLLNRRTQIRARTRHPIFNESAQVQMPRSVALESCPNGLLLEFTVWHVEEVEPLSKPSNSWKFDNTSTSG
ncbi:unnamed protein product [Protopolystoma xenopodis]|uniref:Uncharacterized protein n=1 Tax=Protopolystoma xenopodis TaxID=117903 RepID=A0A448XAT0_9PLAT|nr:unnamed protein product [Protopolystoma xenopodis]